MIFWNQVLECIKQTQIQKPPHNEQIQVSTVVTANALLSMITERVVGS